MPDLETLLNIEDEVTQVLSDLGVTTKLNEMDDFMNQNELKVQITNENTAVTGLVTYTCTVKDKNNTALANRVVEWYKGTTLLGSDATDSNGISTFKHQVSTPDIYDLHAIVKGTHAGDDIRMFVKDKNNIFSFNQWSCGEQLQNVSYFSHSTNANIEVTGEYAVLGNNSLKMTPEELATTWVGRSENVSPNTEVSVTGKINIKCVNCSAKLTLYSTYIEPVEGQSSKSVEVSIPAGTEGVITVSDTIDDNVSQVNLRVSMSSVKLNSIIYWDAAELIVS